MSNTSGKRLLLLLTLWVGASAAHYALMVACLLHGFTSSPPVGTEALALRLFFVLLFPIGWIGRDAGPHPWPVWLPPVANSALWGLAIVLLWIAAQAVRRRRRRAFDARLR